MPTVKAQIAMRPCLQNSCFAQIFGAVSMPMRVAFLIACAGPAFAQSESEFFRGKTVTFGIPSDVGGGYDAHGRLIARYLSKHLPGNPNVVAQNMPAGAGLALANVLYNTAPKDGTAIGLVRASVLYEDLFGGNSAVQFKGMNFNWLGNLNSAHDSCVFGTRAGVSAPADFFAREHIVGADGVAGMDYSFPKVYNDLLGARFKIVTGYKGTPDRILAIQRGEIEGACGVTTSNIKATLHQEIAAGRLKIVVQAGNKLDPDFPNVPNMLDQARTPEQRQTLAFLYAQLELSRPLTAPPGTPYERLKTLRSAFDAAVNDPGFKADAAKQNLDVSTTSAFETAAAVKLFYDSPKAVVDRVRAALRQPTKN